MAISADYGFLMFPQGMTLYRRAQVSYDIGQILNLVRLLAGQVVELRDQLAVVRRFSNT